jgi:hypothetical protein
MPFATMVKSASPSGRSGEVKHRYHATKAAESIAKEDDKKYFVNELKAISGY